MHKPHHKEKSFLGKSLFPLSRKKNVDETDHVHAAHAGASNFQKNTAGRNDQLVFNSAPPSTQSSNEALRLKLLLTDLCSVTYNAEVAIPETLSTTIAHTLGFSSSHHLKCWIENLSSFPDQQHIVNFLSQNSFANYDNVQIGSATDGTDLMNVRSPADCKPELPPKPWEKKSAPKSPSVESWENDTRDDLSHHQWEKNCMYEVDSTLKGSNYLEYSSGLELVDSNSGTDTLQYSFKYDDTIVDEWDNDDDAGYISVRMTQEEAISSGTVSIDQVLQKRSLHGVLNNQDVPLNDSSFDEKDIALAEASLISEHNSKVSPQSAELVQRSKLQIPPLTLNPSGISSSLKTEMENAEQRDHSNYSSNGSCNYSKDHLSVSSAASSRVLSPLRKEQKEIQLSPQEQKKKQMKEILKSDGENVMHKGATELERVEYDDDELTLSCDEDDDDMKDDVLSISSDESLLGNRVMVEKQHRIDTKIEVESLFSSGHEGADKNISDKQTEWRTQVKAAEEQSRTETNKIETTSKRCRAATIEQLDSFPLKVVFEKGITGPISSPNFYCPIGSTIAVRYQVSREIIKTPYSIILHCIDLAVDRSPIIKNSQNSFNNSLDEIKVLRYIKKHGSPDKHNVLSMLDFFYYEEHVIIVTELLGENLYEFSKRLKEGKLPTYFTPGRLKTVMKQCFDAVAFLNRIGLIHCDIKPENIVMKDYQQAHVKLVDFGSATFTSEKVGTYVQSRAYRAPEVVISFPHIGPAIDSWSLGAVLAELLTGKVLFRNESCATLLARITSIVGPLSNEMISMGTDSYMYYTSDGTIFEKSTEASEIHLLYPKKTSLKSRLHGPDELLLDLLTSLLSTDPQDRPFACEVLSHPWFKM